MKLYVGNLPPAYSEEDLQNLFSEFGEIVSAKIIIDRETGRSKGFGFVEFTTQESGENAIKELDKKMIGTKPIIVNEARPQEKRTGGAGGFERRDNTNRRPFSGKSRRPGEGNFKRKTFDSGY